MRLAVHDRERIPPDCLERVYICGPDDLHGELPWIGRTYFSGNHLVVERSESESAWVHVPWRVANHGEITLATATLRERERPYQLEVELARGTLNRLRSQLAHWEMMGLEVPGTLRREVSDATRSFARAATHQDNPAVAADWAGRCLSTAVSAVNELTDAYAAQALRVRRTQTPRLSTMLGVQLGSWVPDAKIARQLPAAFNLASLRLNWRDVESGEGKWDWTRPDAQLEWAQSAGFKIGAGPLLTIDDAGVPDWAYLWEGDFSSLHSFMLDHVRRTVRRYRGKVHLWQLASRMNHGRVLGMTEEQRLQIVAQAIAAVREIDARTPIVVSFDQPWGEYLAAEQLDLAPLHFADALVRADLGLSGLGLEINVGYHPRGSSLRSALAYSRLIDLWSVLELPLLVSLVVPSSAGADSRANGRIHVCGNDGKENISPASQADWLRRHIPLLMAKGAVQVILWNQLVDSLPHEFPNGGLFDSENRPKPAVSVLREMRREYLM